MSVALRVGVLSVAVVLGLGGCTTTKRAAQLVIDHHVGMAQGAIDVVSGKAEEREQRLAQLHADLEQNSAALAVESDQSRKLELLEQHVALQDALIGELMQQGHAHHAAHQQAQADSKNGEAAGGHQH